MDNPYAAPSSNLSGGNSFGAGIGVTQRVADIMRRTMPWARLAGITGILHTILNLIANLSQGAHRSPIAATGVAYIFLGINFYLGVKMLSYARRIGILLQTGRASDLAAALAEHRRYWKIWGLYILVVFILGAFGGVLSGVAAAG